MTILLITLQIFLILIFLALIILKQKPSYFGLLVVMIQNLCLIMIISNRIYGFGFNLFFFLYLVAIPAFLPYVFKLFSREKDTYFKRVIKEFNTRLENSFFNLFTLNYGLFYLSRNLFKKLFLVFRHFVNKPYSLLFFAFFLPWFIFLIILIFEIVTYQRIYLAAILSINFVNYRLFLLILRTLEYFCLEIISYILPVKTKNLLNNNSQSFWLYFQDKNNFLNLEDSDLNKPFLINHWNLFFSGISYSSCYFYVILIKNQLLPYFYNLMNLITFFVTFTSILYIYSDIYWFFPYSIIIFISIIFYLFFLIFSARSIKSSIFSEIQHQKLLAETLIVFKTNFIEMNLLTNKDLSETFIFPPNHLPENFIAWFTKLLIIDSNPKVIYFFNKPNFLFGLVASFTFLSFCIAIGNLESLIFFSYSLSFYKFFDFTLFILFLLLFFLHQVIDFIKKKITFNLKA